MTPPHVGILESIRTIVATMPDDGTWVGALETWTGTARHELVAWLDDIDRALTPAHSALVAAQASSPSPDGSIDLEHALWRIDAAADKLVPFLGLALGVSMITLGKPQGVRFVRTGAAWAKVEQVLKGLAGKSPAAANVATLARQFNEHSVRRLRDELSHALSQLASDGTSGVRPLCSFRCVTHDGHATQDQMRQLYSTSDLWKGGDISAEGVWKVAVGEIGDAYAKFVELLKDVFELLRAEGVLRPQPTVYYDSRTRRASLSPPPELGGRSAG
jgi:hypothetical protein